MATAALTHRVSVRDDGGMTDTAPALYHGTVRDGLDVIEPATAHCGPRTFAYTADGDPGYAYATLDLADAWRYAEKAWHAMSIGIPRVYRVMALGAVEPDPQVDAYGRPRGNYAADVRSRDGFTVVEEMPMPDEYGDPEDWR
jgi:hypothetical protein